MLNHNICKVIYFCLIIDVHAENENGSFSKFTNQLAVRGDNMGSMCRNQGCMYGM